ncbi:UMP kinase [Spiroplasma endosymbiont of Amphibalanus improvisus]|uniref:UMP kinase n=1 Tax=Spiroplasma endosymbiont of Amphibalanus improvisus TaxID=3066327 RepID=UPI00313E273B
MLKYKRCLLKLSGESLGGVEKGQLYSFERLNDVVKQIIKLKEEGMELGIVVGGGNIWRGVFADKIHMDKINADYMGMMATVMNALALESVFKKNNYNKVIITSAIEINKIGEPFYHKKVIKRLEEGYIVIMAAGTGFSHFTTDTAAILRAIEVKADIVFMAKNGVDGVYSDDPKTNPKATKYDEVLLNELIKKQLLVMDQTASTLAMDGKIDILVFDVTEKDNIYKAAHGTAKVTKVIGG